MRLIDADEAKKFYKENLILPEKSHEIIVRTMIDAVPTAYDLDKVVEELESEKRYGSKYDSYYEVNLYRGEMFENDANNKTIDRAIEIVKQGGVSDDVCEWKLDGVYLHSPHKPLVSCVTDENYRYHYCPVCGKKIKVVE